MNTLVEVLAQHQLVSRGLSYGSPDRCLCGVETLPERGDEDVFVRRNRAFAEHQSAVVAEWLTSDGAVEAVERALGPRYGSCCINAGQPGHRCPRLAPVDFTLAALAAHAKGEADE